MPEVLDLARQWREELLRGEQAALNEMARQWLAVEAELREGFLETATAAVQGQWGAGDLRRQRRYLSLLAQTQEQLDKYGVTLDQQVTSRRLQAAAQAYANAAKAVYTAADDAQIAVTFNSLPFGAVERMTALAAQGPVWSLLNDAAGAGVEAVGRELVTGVALGRAPADIARRMMRGGLGVTFTRAATIARTEVLRSYRMATIDAYRASGAVVGYRRLAAHERRTCVGCLFSDGKEYSLNEPFDQHPACRCTLVPVLANAPLPQWETGQEWFVRQSEDVQREMLGAGRYDLWQRGRIGLDDLIKRTESRVWGGSLGPRPLKELSAAGQPTGVRSSRQGANKRATISGGSTAQAGKPMEPPVQVPQAAPVEPAAPRWRPSMSREEAELWARESAIQHDVYHVTDAENVTSLKRNGFDLNRSRFGRVWGNGVYVTPDENTAAMYENWAGGPARTLAIRLDVRKPLMVDVSRVREADDMHKYILKRVESRNPGIWKTYVRHVEDFEKRYWEAVTEGQALADQAPPSRKRKVFIDFMQQAIADGRIPTGSPSAAALNQTLQDYGYDSLHITETPITGRVGGNQIVIFDPKQVVIIDELY